MALYKNRAPHWNLKNGGIGTRWEATVGNLRIQLTNYFAFPDLPVTGWDRLNILNTPGCTTDGNGNSILPADRNDAPITADQLAGADPKSFIRTVARLLIQLWSCSSRRQAEALFRYVKRCLQRRWGGVRHQGEKPPCQICQPVRHWWLAGRQMAQDEHDGSVA